MKTLAPIKRLMRLEIVPFEAHTRDGHAAMQRQPARAKLLPGSAFGEERPRVFFQCGGHSQDYCDISWLKLKASVLSQFPNPLAENQRLS
jgi:hypothetical protein